jgi:hypothetical protein
MTTSKTDGEPLCYAKREQPEDVPGEQKPPTPTATQTFTFVAEENRDCDPN